MSYKKNLIEMMQQFLDSSDCFVPGLVLMFDQNGYWLELNGTRFEGSDSQLILSAAKKFAERSLGNG